MRIPRTPGEAIEVDWAGDPMSYADPLTGASVKAWLFVAALPYSAYTYVEAFTDMTLGSWIEAHVHAFDYFGGAARLLIPDTLRAGVAKADRYEPVLRTLDMESVCGRWFCGLFCGFLGVSECVPGLYAK